MNRTYASWCRHKPIFIVGCSRSGTTLLQSMLAMDDQIGSFPETAVFHFLAGVHGNGREPIDSRDLKAVCHRSSHFASEPSANIDWEHLIDELAPEQRCRDEFLRTYFDTLCSLGGLNRFIEKTPIHVRYMAEIRNVFPDAKIVFIYRDPRDVAASFKKHFRLPVFIAAIQWLRAWRQFERATLAGNQVHAVRFEDLVKNPKQILSGMAPKLELSYSDTWLQYHNREDLFFDPQVEAHKIETSRPLNPKVIGAYRKVLSPVEIALVEAMLVRQMKAAGYEARRSARGIAAIPIAMAAGVYHWARLKRSQLA